MKKKIALLLAATMLVSLTGCNMPVATATAAKTEVAEAAEAEAADVKSEGVMTYEEYAAAPLDSEVTVETYVQATQSWWNDSITVYSQDKDGAYFIYGLACSEEDAAKLVPGTKIKVKGYKAEWSGEIEITDATFEIEEGSYIAEAKDVTEYLGTDDLVNYQNQFVSVKGLKVEEASDGSAFLYNWDGSGTQGDDVYVNFSLNDNTYSFLVESYLCGMETDVYKAAEGLSVGDTVDIEGFMYWYEGPNMHITNITVK